MKQKLKLGENETEYESLSEDEVKTIVGETLDDRLSKLAIPEALDTDAFKKDILDSVTNLFQEHKTPPMDEESFLKKIDKTLDTKLANALKGIGNGNPPREKQPGPLSRFLSG